MALFKVVVEAFVASRELDQASLSRLAFWCDELGEKEIAAITADDIDAALLQPRRARPAHRRQARHRAQRQTPRRLHHQSLSHPGRQRVQAREAPAARAAHLRRAHPRHRARPRARRTPSAICGPRKSSARSPWRASSIATGARCRRSSPSPITPGCAWARSCACAAAISISTPPRSPSTARRTATRSRRGCRAPRIAELKRLPKAGADELVFGNRAGKPFTYMPLWKRIAEEARLPGRVFHELRHGHGYRLAQAGVSQQMIMHEHGAQHAQRSARYAHASIDDKKAVIERVFG